MATQPDMPLLELIARRIRTEAESKIETFNLRPRQVIALTLLQLVGEQSYASKTAKVLKSYSVATDSTANGALVM